jgi:hypothetical protein
MNSPASVLLFVEDPGAANYVAGLPPAFAGRGLSCRLFATGAAVEYLRQRGIAAEAIPPGATAAQHLAALRPDLVLVGTSENPDTLGLALVTEARRLGVPSLGAVDALANSDHRFRGRSCQPLAHAPDWLLVPDQATADAFAALGYPPGRAVVCGHPHYQAVRAVSARLASQDRSQVRRAVLPEAALPRQVVVFAAEISDGLNPAQYQRSPEYTLAGRGGSTARTAIVLEELLDALPLLRPRPYLVLRMHPKNHPDEFAAYAAEIDHVSRGGSPLELLHAADLVVGMTSMLLLEASLLDRLTLSIVPRPAERDWLPTTRSGLTPCATRREELRALLPQLLAVPSAPSGLASALPDRPEEAILGVVRRALERKTHG